MAIMDRLLVWGLLSRGLALVYAISFGSLCWRRQVLALAGSRGIAPLAAKLAAVRRDCPGWPERLRRWPTLFWLSASDDALALLPHVGGALALAALCGGAHAPVCFALVWALYLSLDMPVGLKFPWDSLLLEAGFLAPLLPATASLLSLPTTAAAAPAAPLTFAALHLPPAGVAFLYRLLLVRVMVGFGRVKFEGHKSRDNCYIQGFLISQPMPSVPGWLASHLPFAVHKFAVTGMFVIEIIVPWFCFCTGSARAAAAAAIISLMFGIQLTGNFGYFNVLTTVVALACFDTESSVFLWDEWWQDAAPVQSAFSRVMVPCLFSLALLSTPFQSWCNEAWVHWPVAIYLDTFSTLLGRLGALCRWVSPFRIVAAYGVFPPSASPALRFVTILEGSADEDGDDDWREYQWRFMTSGDGDDPRSAPMFIAPHHPRIDHSIFYTAFGINQSNMLVSTTSGDPYGFNPDSSATHRIGVRLLEGDCAAVSDAFFQVDPFRGRRPPRRVRATLYTYAATSMKVWWESGCTRWWVRRRIGEHMAPISLRDPEVVAPRATAPAHPDMFAVDHIPAWFPKHLGHPKDAVAAADRPDEQLFWQRFVPSFGASTRCRWAGKDCIVKAAAGLRAAHDPAAVAALKAVHARSRTRLVRLFEPLYFEGAKGRAVRRSLLGCPVGDASFSILELVANHIIGQGRDAYRRACDDPERALLGWATDDLTIDAGLFLPAVLYPRMFRFHARKWSVSLRVSFPPDAEEEAAKQAAKDALLAAAARGEDVDVPAEVPPAFFLWVPKWINQQRIQEALGVAGDQVLPLVVPPDVGQLWGVDMTRNAAQLK